MQADLFRYKIKKLEPDFLEVEGLTKGDYDKKVFFYDKFIGNEIYNRIVWGNKTKNYLDFCSEAFKESKNGMIADIACGTLNFTQQAYIENHKKNIYLCDLSYEMLKLGRRRIKKNVKDRSNIIFLRSNALDMPFNNETIQTVFCFGLLHIFDNPSELLLEMIRILKPGGQIYFNVLCTDRKISKLFMRLLHKKGHIARPMDSETIKNTIEENGFKVTGMNVKGGMVYVSGIKIDNLIHRSYANM